MSGLDAITLVLGVALTLIVMSGLARETALCRVVVQLFVGVSAAYWMVIAFWSTLVPNLLGRIEPALLRGILPGTPEGESDPTLLVPLALGLLLVVPLPRRARSLARWPIAFAAGFAAGVAIPRFLVADLLMPMSGACVPLIVASDAGVSDGRAIDVRASISNTAAVVSVCAALVALTVPPRDGSGHAARDSCRAAQALAAFATLGRAILSIAFGAILAGMIASRVSALAGRIAWLEELARFTS